MSALIVGYGLASFGLISAEGLIYQLLNLTGGIGLMIVAASKKLIQSILLNVFWAVIGVIALARLIF